MFNSIDEQTVEKLIAIAGKENVFTAAEDTEPYAHDEVAELRGEPEAVVPDGDNTQQSIDEVGLQTRLQGTADATQLWCVGSTTAGSSRVPALT